MAQEQSNQEPKQPQHHHCGNPLCTEDVASERARLAEERWDNGLGGKLDAKIEEFTIRGEEIFTAIKKKIEPYTLERTTRQIDEHLNRFDSWLLKRREIAQQYNETHPKQPISVSGRKIVAGMTTASALFVPVANVSPTIARQPEPRVVPMSLFDPQVSTNIKENIERDPVLSQYVTPTVDTANGNRIRLQLLEQADSEVQSQTLTTISNSGEVANEQASDVDKSEMEPNQEFPNAVTIDVSKFNHEAVNAIARAINKEIPEGQTVVTINKPAVGSLAEGQNPTDIAFAMLDSADKDSKAAMYAVTHLIVAMNDIDIASGEDRVIQPGTALLLPRETATIADTEETVESVESLDAQEIEEQVDELISAVKVVETPMPIKDEAFEIGSKPTPVSDELDEQKTELIESIQAGENTIAAIQSEAIAELSKQNPRMNVEDIASELVTNAFIKAGVEATDEQIEQAIKAVASGIEAENEPALGLEATDDEHVEESPKSILEISDELEKQLDTKRADIENAISRIEALGIEVTIDVDKLSKKLVSAEAKGELVGDTLYYLLVDGEDTTSRVDRIRDEIAPSIYSSLYADKLLQNGENQVQIIKESAELLSQDFIDLGTYISTLEERVSAEIDKGKEAVVPVIAEVSSFFSEVDEVSEEKLIRLAVEGVDGASPDFIRMSLLQEIAQIRDVNINEVIHEYLGSAFEQAGLGEVISNEQIDGITSLALVYWQDEDYVQRHVQLNPEEVINGMYDSALVDMLFDNDKYLEGVDTTTIDHDKINDILLGHLQGEKDPSYYNIRFIQALQSDQSAVVQYLLDYYESKDAAYYLNQDAILVALAEKLLSDDSTSPEQYIEALGGYSGNPEEIFPEGRQYILSGYEGGDLTEFISAAGLDLEKLIANPLNDHIEVKDGVIVASQPTIWFADASTIDEARLKKAHDEVILGIRPPAPTVPEVNNKTIERQSSNPIVSSLDNIKFEDKVNNLDDAVNAINSWYASFDDPDKDPAMPDGYVRMPSHEFFEDLDIPFTWAEKTAKVEQYTSPVTAAALLATAELYQQILADYPQYAGSMLRVRDLNSAHHSTHNTGTQADISTNMNAEVNRASTGPIMDYISGDGSENDYNMQMNLDFAVKLASLKYEGERVINRILTSDKELAAKVNESLGYKFMSAVNYHREHWHLTFKKHFALPKFSPVSPFDELGYKGDLGIGSEYVEPPTEMVEQEHGEFSEAIEEVVVEVTEEEKAAEEAKAAKAEQDKKLAEEKAEAEAEAKAATEKAEQDRLEAEKKAEAEAKQAEEAKRNAEAELPPGISAEQLVVSQANSVEELVALGYTSLAKIPKADQKAFNEVLAQRPTIQEALEKYNYRQGGSKGPSVPATAVLAIAYDAGLRGDELIEAATTGSGESIGFHPYVIGDDKGERSEDDQPMQFAVGLFQFFIKNKDGVSEQQLDRGNVLLNPVVNILEMVQYKNDRGFQPWYFNQNKEKQPEAWNAHRDKVLIAANAIEEGGFDILP